MALSSGAGRNGIYVRRSPDGGKTWEKDAVPVRAWYTGREPNMEYEDMPRIFADASLPEENGAAIFKLDEERDAKIERRKNDEERQAGNDIKSALKRQRCRNGTSPR